MNRYRQSRENPNVRCVLALALVISGAALVAACGDDDAGGDNRDAGRGGAGGEGGSDGGGEGGTDAGGAGTGGTGTGGTGGTGTGGAGPEPDAGGEDAGMDPGAMAYRDLMIEMTAMTPHVGQLMHFRVVSSEEKLVALGVLDPIEAADVDFAFPNSISDGGHRLDFFADLNGNGNYNPPQADHAWRLEISAVGDVTLMFMHNTTFTNIAMPAVTEAEDFTFNATSMAPHMNQLFELRVTDQETGRLVGRYVLGEVTTADFSLELAGIVEAGKTYRVDFTADLNGNGTYDAPPADHAWREMADATAAGLTVDFAHNTTFTDVMF